VSFVKRADDDTGHDWQPATGGGISCACMPGRSYGCYSTWSARDFAIVGKCPRTATTTSAQAASTSIPGPGPTVAWPPPKFAPRGADKSGHQWSRVDHPEDGDILECHCGEALGYASYCGSTDEGLSAYSKVYPCRGAPIASNQCTQCRTQLSSYLDAYYGTNAAEGRKCAKCRGRRCA
jgi:hypothetical protein